MNFALSYNTGDGAVGLEEFRFDCVNRNAYRTVDELNQAYEKLLTVGIGQIKPL